MKIKNLVLGPLGTNCYILGCNETKEAVIIDPADEPDIILSELEKESWQAKYILLTHAHLDHIGALADIKNATGATILMHPRERIVLNGVEMQAMMLGLKAPQVPSVEKFVNDGDKISFGNLQLTVLETPGHTPGGVSFLAPNCVFVGDVLFAGSVGRTDLPGASHEILMHSICEKLLVLSEDTVVYSGHGPNTTIGEEKFSNPFISCR